MKPNLTALLICASVVFLFAGCTRDDVPSQPLKLSKQLVVLEAFPNIPESYKKVSDTIRILSGNSGYTVSVNYDDDYPLPEMKYVDAVIEGDSIIIINMVDPDYMYEIFEVTDSKNKKIGFGVTNIWNIRIYRGSGTAPEILETH